MDLHYTLNFGFVLPMVDTLSSWIVLLSNPSCLARSLTVSFGLGGLFIVRFLCLLGMDYLFVVVGIAVLAFRYQSAV